MMMTRAEIERKLKVDIVFLDTEAGDDLLTESGDFIILEVGGNVYSITGTGGASGGDDGNEHVGFEAGLITHFVANCRLFTRESFVVCKRAYIPVLTRCNQVIISEEVEELCVRRKR